VDAAFPNGCGDGGNGVVHRRIIFLSSLKPFLYVALSFDKLRTG
jgi:hypothetical protein